MDKEEILFKEKIITIDDCDECNESIYTQFAQNIAKSMDIDLAKTPLVDLLTTYTHYITIQQRNKYLQQRIDKLETSINEYIEELSWVENTDEELRNVKIINRLKKILKELE